MIAICQIRQEPNYRREAFVVGLRNAGYSLVNSGRPASKMDLLVIWNRYGGAAAMADTWERHGGTVLVCENGYIGKDAQGRQLYAIAANGHNGSGWWPIGVEDRFSKLGIELKPWLDIPEGHLLVCGQRGIGTKRMASPDNWHNLIANQIKGQVELPIKIRTHPGTQPAKTTLDADLVGASACVVWSSSSGVKALATGCPVYYAAPNWICESAALRVSEIGRARMMDDATRAAAFHKLAWAQWSVAEIESGEPFRGFAAALDGRA